MAKLTLGKLKEAAAVLNRDLVNKPLPAKLSYRIAVAFMPINAHMEALDSALEQIRHRVAHSEITNDEASDQFADLLKEEVEIDLPDSKISIDDLDGFEIPPSVFILADFIFTE